MSASESHGVTVRELIGWDLDVNELRPRRSGDAAAIEGARLRVSDRASYAFADPVVASESDLVATLLAEQTRRSDLQDEMRGLDWSAGIVDLRRLLSFQRRLIFDPEYGVRPVPAPDDWSALCEIAFARPVPITYTTVASNSSAILLRSHNPNLNLQFAANEADVLVRLHGGSPFLEVAEYGGRWFLRDGYHRAYALLRATVFRVPAVILRARTLAELGAVHPWFFAEDALFGPHPPLVTDFLDDELTMEYARARMVKTIRVCMEESLAPAALDLVSHSGELL